MSGQALSESEVLERNLENTDVYEPIDVKITDVKVDGLSCGSDSGTRSSAQEEGKQPLLGSTDIDEARSMERHTPAASRKDNRTWKNSGT